VIDLAERAPGAADAGCPGLLARRTREALALAPLARL